MSAKVKAVPSHVVKKKLEQLRAEMLSAWENGQERKKWGCDIESALEQPLSSFLNMSDEEYSLWKKSKKGSRLPVDVFDYYVSERQVEMIRQKSFLWEEASRESVVLKFQLEELRGTATNLWHNGVFCNGMTLPDALQMRSWEFESWQSNRYRMV